MVKKNIPFLIIACFLVLLGRFSGAEKTLAGEAYTLKAGVSMVDRVPNSFYGTWRIASTLVSTNSESRFKQKTVDLWNLSRSGNVITLENPFSGARASIVVDEASSKLIKFKKNGFYDGKKATDIVQLQLSGDSFSGTNVLILETVSDIDQHIMKSEKATYRLVGEKISGSNVIK